MIKLMTFSVTAIALQLAVSAHAQELGVPAGPVLMWPADPGAVTDLPTAPQGWKVQPLIQSESSDLDQKTVDLSLDALGFKKRTFCIRQDAHYSKGRRLEGQICVCDDRGCQWRDDGAVNYPRSNE